MTLSQNQIKKKYNRFSLFYDLVEWPIEKLLFSKWRKKLLKNSKGKVLEIGVGTGKNLSYYNYHKIDLTVIDINAEFTINKNDFYSKSKNTPFNGRKVKGRAVKTFLSGHLVFEL